MFNNKYGLTRAVLEEWKTQTRRIAYIGDIKNADVRFLTDGKERGTCVLCDGCRIVARSAYKIDEEVAIAQPYKDTWQHTGYMSAFEAKHCPGYNNKMFVRAEEMPHRIRITNIRVERLQDISESDCLKEGVKTIKNVKGDDVYSISDGTCFTTARLAFASLIDKVSGKGTWDSNPFVFVYDFELVK